MRQSIYPDPHALETWDTKNTSRSFVHIVDSELWRVKSVKEKDLEKSTHPLQQDGSVAVPVVVKLGVKGATRVDVRDGGW